MEIFLTSDAWISLLMLTFMEIVLGVDNIIFISIVSGKLPEEKQGRARTYGLLLALVFRILLLLSITWIIGLTKPIFEINDFLFIDHFALTWRDLILLAGGLFLLGKSVSEMHHKLEGVDDEQKKPKATGFAQVIAQIVMLDIVFSFDSILTAIGLADHVIIMIIAVIISLGIMLAFAKKISDFINARPTMKMLALAFLLLIGFTLAFDSLHSLHHQEIPKGYIYFAMFFAFGVELLNMRIRKTSPEGPVDLRDKIQE
jgi:predicted tellurium resistance membrane protein TerC